jgi:hypothetical protein
MSYIDTADDANRAPVGYGHDTECGRIERLPVILTFAPCRPYISDEIFAVGVDDHRLA